MVNLNQTQSIMTVNPTIRLMALLREAQQVQAELLAEQGKKLEKHELELDQQSAMIDKYLVENKEIRQKIEDTRDDVSDVIRKTEKLTADIQNLKDNFVVKNPILAKHSNVSEQIRLELLEKYNQHDLQRQQIIKGCEKISKCAIGYIKYYIEETKRKYSYNAKFHYSPKYDEYFYIICCTFFKRYYGEDKYERFLMGL